MRILNDLTCPAQATIPGQRRYLWRGPDHSALDTEPMPRPDTRKRHEVIEDAIEGVARSRRRPWIAKVVRNTTKLYRPVDQAPDAAMHVIMDRAGCHALAYVRGTALYVMGEAFKMAKSQKLDLIDVMVRPVDDCQPCVWSSR